MPTTTVNHLNVYHSNDFRIWFFINKVYSLKVASYIYLDLKNGRIVLTFDNKEER